MIYLTETFADHKLNDAIATEWAEHNEDLAQTYFSNITKKGSAGVAILLRGKLSKAKVTKKLETAPARTVSIEIEIENQKHTIAEIHGEQKIIPAHIWGKTIEIENKKHPDTFE